MAHIIMTRGIPASGKTTWSKDWVSEAPASRMRVSRDDIRKMLRGTLVLNRQAEEIVSQIEKAAVAVAVRQGFEVVVDATNLEPRFVAEWRALGYDITFVDFPVSLDEALKRNRRRGYTVPEYVIKRYYKRYTHNGGILKEI